MPARVPCKGWIRRACQPVTDLKHSYVQALPRPDLLGLYLSSMRYALMHMLLLHGGAVALWKAHLKTLNLRCHSATLLEESSVADHVGEVVHDRFLFWQQALHCAYTQPAVHPSNMYSHMTACAVLEDAVWGMCKCLCPASD